MCGIIKKLLQILSENQEEPNEKFWYRWWVNFKINSEEIILKCVEMAQDGGQEHYVSDQFNNLKEHI